MKKTILEIKNLNVHFDSVHALKDVSFSVAAGEAVAVIGPNGAGKSVLFRALLSLVPYQGRVTWRPGVSIGYVPQKFSADTTVPITVQEFFLLKASGFWSPNKDFVEHLDHEFSLVGLHRDILARPLSALSGGELQRALIAWAMLNHPDVLLFDEPTSGVDAGFEETIYQVMRRVQEERGTTVLVISHDLNVVYRYAQNVVCLNRSVVCQGPPATVLNPHDLAKLYGEGAYYQHHDNPLR